MVNNVPQENVVEFFQTLSDLMLSIEVTDANGKALSLAQGGEQASEMLTEVKRSGRKIMLVGNGGSSAIVSHAHNDLCKSVGVRAMVFNEQSLLTAYANDDGYGSIYAHADTHSDTHTNPYADSNTHTHL